MKTCTLIMAYYDNAQMLERHVEEWLYWSAYASSRVRVTIVDDGSPSRSAEDVLRTYDRALAQNGVELSLYRIVPDIPWNQDGARNLGMRECTTPWALLTDMDHVMPAAEVEKMAAVIDDGRLPPATFFMPKQWTVQGQEIPPHPNTFLFRKSDFWAMGGYDEDFAGSYGSDGNFRKCAKKDLIESKITSFGLVVYRRTDVADANTIRYGRKDSEYYSHSKPHLRDKMKGPAYQAKNPIRFEWWRVI